MSLILNAASSLHLLGGKAASLAALQDSNLPIPRWFVVSPRAFWLSLGEEKRRALETCKNADEIQNLLNDLQASADVIQAIHEALISLQTKRVAVRSSALDEDGASHSFAGQLESYLYVSPNNVADKVVDVWRSGFSERVLLYRQEAHLPLIPSPPAVLVQSMVNAETSGVAFAADPITGRRSVAVVSAVYGLGSALVSGESDADTFQVDRKGTIITRSIANKVTQQVWLESTDLEKTGSLETTLVPAEKVTVAALTDAQIRQVAFLSREVSKHFHRPQDIEFAFEKGTLYLLQSRPITSLVGMADPDGAVGIWDNSNIVESYGGVTTPLTFSFALYAYENVYRELLRVLGVSKAGLESQENTFKHMLGLINGCVYYNLLSWYKLLSVLPGYRLNRSFMEQMMGVKEGIPEHLLPKGSTASSSWERFVDGFNLAKSIVQLVVAYQQLPRSIRKFYKRLESSFELDVPLSEMRPDELVAHYRRLESRLLTHWDAPLVNDFFAMIFYGTLRKLCESWLGDKDGNTQNDLVSGEGGMISAEPAYRVKEMAQFVSSDPAFVKLLNEGSLQTILKAMETRPQFKEKYDAYLEKFGDRCLEELKLETATLHDDPLLLLRSVGGLAQHPDKLAKIVRVEHSLRQQAEEKVSTMLTQPLKRRVFNWVLKQARARVRDRENLRFERTKVFGHARRIFLEFGKRFYAQDLLTEPRDIFYLEVKEILGMIEGVNTTTNLKVLAALRKKEFETYHHMPAPDNRFETTGIVYQGHSFKNKTQTAMSTEGDTRKGLGCCPGVVRGRVRVVTDPREARLEPGEILVAERTDPGWIMLFPAASGLLVGRGSLLSHSAIVSREMGIPAIVSLEGVTAWLKTGDIVEFDGSTGVVQKLNAETVEGLEAGHAQK
jgi:rifampicin phosphotransferase